MGDGVFQTALDCCNRVSRRGSCQRHHNLLMVFTTRCSLEFVTMDILGLLTTSAKGHQYILVITNGFTNFCQAVFLISTTGPAVAQAFLENWVYPYGIVLELLTNNGSQFVLKLFKAVFSMLDIKCLTAAAYHLRNNAQTERLNKSLVERFRHFVAEYHTECKRTCERWPMKLICK